MSDTPQFCRKYHTICAANDPRKPRKFAVTDTEYNQIQAMVNQHGFDKLRDYLVYLSNHQDSNTAVWNRYQQMVIEVHALATHVNKIEAEVDVKQAQADLLEGVKRLCLTYRL